MKNANLAVEPNIHTLNSRVLSSTNVSFEGYHTSYAVSGPSHNYATRTHTLRSATHSHVFTYNSPIAILNDGHACKYGVLLKKQKKTIMHGWRCRQIDSTMPLQKHRGMPTLKS